MRIKQLCLMILLLLCVAAAQAQYDSAVIRRQQALAGSVKSVNDKAITPATKVKKVNAQADSLLASIQAVPAKYITKIDDKIDKYSDRITGKTEKTLAKLSKWETKIKGLLEQASPETAAKLFGPGKMTFSTVLQKIKEGKAVAEGYKAKYDAYRDKLNTSMAYLGEQKSKLDKNLLQPLDKANNKLAELEKDVANTEAVEAFIKERKKELMNEAIKYIGKSKYLKKIDKEAYYYVETLRNYKEIFSDPKKTEETALAILNRIPAFKNFVERNSMLAGLFRAPSASFNPADFPNLQTRAGVGALVQQRLAAGGPNARETFSQHMQQAQAELNKLKDKVIQAGGNGGDGEAPDFKPNNQKSKTFMQRLEFGSNLQFGKSGSLLPATADIALSLGYKLNDKSLLGIGVSYKAGIGKINRLAISHQGIGLRSFADWKLKKQFFISGGYELNHNAGFKKVEELKGFNAWQQSGLVGITKKFNIKTKFFKGSSVQLLYDVLYRQHVPVSQPVLFRMGYKF